MLTCKSCLAGLPQGSVLGQFLFTFYMYDFSKIINTEGILYSDDSALFCSSYRPRTIL